MSVLHPDLDLAKRAADGDNAAWREIYTQSRDRLFALLVYHIGNREEALDVLQETYLAAVKGLSRYKGTGSLESWLCGIALRRARDWKRRMLRKFKKTDSMEDAHPVEEIIPQPDPEEKRRLHAALNTLPERQRSAVLLHEWLGYSFGEIGEILGISEATARVHSFRARETLRGLLGEDSVGKMKSDAISEETGLL